jgi:hypothetical protein
MPDTQALESFTAEYGFTWEGVAVSGSADGESR